MALDKGCFIFLLALSAASNSSVAWADTLNSVSCSTPIAGLATGTATCSAIGLYGYANASASSNIVPPTSVNQTAQIDTSASVSAFLGGIRGITTQSMAKSSSTIAINFDTAGPVQDGYIELTFSQNSWCAFIDGSANESLTVGTYSISPNGQDLAAVFIPIELGTEFSFTYRDSLTAYADAASGPTSGLISAAISVQAFEADKTTAIDLFNPSAIDSNLAATPEPATLVTMAFALGAFLLLIRNNRP